MKVDLIQKAAHDNMVQDALCEWKKFQAMITIVANVLVANVFR
jgi:hypothetical protein